MAVTMSKVQAKSVEGERKRLEQEREIAKSEKRLNIKVPPERKMRYKGKATYFRIVQRKFHSKFKGNYISSLLEL